METLQPSQPLPGLQPDLKREDHSWVRPVIKYAFRALIFIGIALAVLLLFPGEAH